MNKENPTTQQINTKKFPTFTRSNNGKQVYCEYDGGIWYKWEYDDNGKQIYLESSDGILIDKRSKPIPEYTMEELVNKLGYNFKIKK
jgi:hypothetical protein